MEPIVSCGSSDICSARRIQCILRNMHGFQDSQSNDKHVLSMPEIPESISFPMLEHEVIRHWNEIKAFDQHLAVRKHHQNMRNDILDECDKKLTRISSQHEAEVGAIRPIVDAIRNKIANARQSNNYVFYEGPPFATGLPHYGHLLAATIKDAVCRYFSNIPFDQYAKGQVSGNQLLSDAQIDTRINNLDGDSSCKEIASGMHEILSSLGHMPNGFHIERVAGWDCHGLPIEFEIEKELGIKTKMEVEKFGIGPYNEHCRAIVLRYKEEWKKVIERIGRWLDFDEKKEYKTMDVDYMESVWYIFHKLHEQKLVYRGFKVMPFSIGCGTPISNFEANLNYKDINDISMLVGFPILKAEKSIPENTMLVAWTTTLWTLPANLALIVNPDMQYVLVQRKKGPSIDHFIVAECRYEFFLGMMKQKTKENQDVPEWNIQSTFPGKELKGAQYRPPFSHVSEVINQLSDTLGFNEYAGFSVLCDSFVSSTAGTGIVHCAPCFGEDDYRACTENGLISVGDDEAADVSAKILSHICPVDENGYFTAGVGDHQLVGKFIKGKDAEAVLLDHIKSNHSLLAKGTIVHSYPFCWRSEVPLIYKAVSSWFVNINALRERMVTLVTEQTHWVPGYVCEKRFVNWIKGTITDDPNSPDGKCSKGKDWAISRSRFWGTPLPIWMSQDGNSIVVIRSIQELKERAFVKNKNTTEANGKTLNSLSTHDIPDLHRHHIDEYVVPDPRGEEYPPLKRVPDVFDCWFESGCMPYAHRHFPFCYDGENVCPREQFFKQFPANFIAEGLDQTRGWFYTLLVLSTAIFDTVPFKNVIVNGLILAGDGRKMSKKLKNYPDPSEVIEEYGADALRMYFLNSGAVRGEPTKFSVDGVREMVKDIFIPLTSTLKFFVQNVNRYLRAMDVSKSTSKTHPLEVLRAYYVAVSTTDGNLPTVNSNIMDQWILSETQTLIEEFHEAMASYHLYAVPGKLLAFLHLLTNFYVRMNRSRMKGRDGVQDQLFSLMSLLHVLYNLIMLISSFSPFFAEFAYAAIRPLLPDALNQKSVHFCILPSSNAQLKVPSLETTFFHMRTVIEGIRTLRDQQKIPLKTPLKSVILAHPCNVVCEDMLREEIIRYMAEEMNVLYIECANVYDLCHVELQPNLPVLGKKFKKTLKDIVIELKKLSQKTILEWLRKKDATAGAALRLEGLGIDLEPNDMNIIYTFNDQDHDSTCSAFQGEAKENFKSISAGSFTLFLNTNYKNNEELQAKTLSRYFISHVQQLRKKHNFHPSDEIEVLYKIFTDERSDERDESQTGMKNLNISNPSALQNQSPSKEKIEWIQSCLQSSEPEMAKKLNVRIIANEQPERIEKMNETVPFFEAGLCVKMIFY